MNQRRKIGAGRYTQQHESKDSGGVSRAQAVDFSKSKIKNDFITYEAGSCTMEIIPYEIKSKLHPEVHAGRMKIGELDYVLDVFIHRYTGPSEADVLCPKKNYGKPCPICDEVSRLYDEGKNDEAKQLQTSRRCYYNVKNHGKAGLENTKTFHVSHFLFTNELMEEANAITKGNGVIPFAEIDDGKTIECRAAKKKFGTRDMIEYKSFKFFDREVPLEYSMIDESISFDECLVLKTPEEIEAIMFGADMDDDLKPDQPGTRERIREEASEEETKAEPVVRGQRRQQSAQQCPYRHTFGVDCDAHSECATCPDATYTACSKAN